MSIKTFKEPKVKKIACIGDIHLFKNKRFHEHLFVFNELYKQLDEFKPELIIIGGDIIDSKLNISTEQVILLKRFLFKLLKYCPIIQILGNHDLNLQNKERENLIEACVEEINTTIDSIDDDKERNKIYFYKHSEIVNQFNLNFAIWSCFDDQKSPFIDSKKNEELYTIGLYHGSVKGCISDNGFRLTEGIEISEFDDCDLVVLADIHKQQSFRNDEVIYVGSMIQTKTNESDYGSYLQLEWDEDENKYEVKVKKLNNKYSTIVHKIKNVDIVDEKVFGENIAREKQLRIEYDRNIVSKSRAIDYKKQVQLQYPDNKIILVPKTKTYNKDVVLLEGEEEEMKQETKLDLKAYIKDFLKRFSDKMNVKDLEEDFKKVLSLDKEYESGLNIQNEFEEGDFYIESLLINNLFSFPPSDVEIKLDYDDIIGINGKNKSGKTSIVKIIDFALFNSIPDNTTSFRKILNKHNRDKTGYVKIVLVKNQTRYELTRTLIPKKTEGITSRLEFINLNTGEELHDESRPKTEPIIQKYFGLENMFHILSLFSAQKKQTEFIDCKNADRLKLVNKFLGLQNFEEKEKLVKDDLKVKNKLLQEKLNDFQFLKSDAELEVEKEETQTKINYVKTKIQEKEEEIETLEVQYQKIYSKLEKFKAISDKSIRDKEELEEEIEKLKHDSSSIVEQIDKINKQIEELKEEIEDKTKEIILFENKKERIVKEHNDEIEVQREQKERVNKQFNKIKEQLNDFVNEELEAWTPNYKFIKSKEDEFAVLQSDIKKLNKQLMMDVCNNCGRNFTNEDKIKTENEIKKAERQMIVLQKEIKEFYEVEESKQQKQNKYVKEKREIETQITNKEREISTIDVNISNISSKLKEGQGKLELSISQTNVSIHQLKSEIESKKLLIEKTKNKTKDNELRIKEIEEIIEAKEMLKEYMGKITPIKEKRTEAKNVLNSLNEIKGNYHQNIKYIQKQIEIYVIKRDELHKMEEEQRIYSIYRSLVNKDGLPLYILKNRINAINTEINIIVNQIFDFDIIFSVNEEDGELNLEFVYDEDIEKNDISLASGAETFIINLCIKVGLTQISELPKLRSLIVDEGFGTLDKQNIDKVPDLFTSLMSYYKNIILISHLDEMKDLYKYSINVSKEGKYTEIS